jgi:hypothetical protein
MNSLVVEHGDAGELAAIPGVMRVYPVYRVKATLNRVIHLHKVIDAWQAAGGVENAGLGVKSGSWILGSTRRIRGFRMRKCRRWRDTRR